MSYWHKLLIVLTVVSILRSFIDFENIVMGTIIMYLVREWE